MLHRMDGFGIAVSRSERQRMPEIIKCKSRDVPGAYEVDVNGLIGSFTVKEKSEEVVPPGFNWPLTGGLIAATVIVGLLIYYLVRRRRKA